MKNVIFSILISVILSATLTAAAILYLSNQSKVDTSQPTPIVVITETTQPNPVPVVTPEPEPQPEADPPLAETPQPAPAPDPFEGWQTISPGGIIELKIPSNCHTDGAAGSTYIVCPEFPGNTPPPDMVVSSDGESLRIRRWENLAWPEWDKVISSIRILPNLDRDVTIFIQG